MCMYTRGTLVVAHIRMGRDVYGPLQVHVNGQDESKGVMVNPS